MLGDRLWHTLIEFMLIGTYTYVPRKYNLYKAKDVAVIKTLHISKQVNTQIDILTVKVLYLVVIPYHLELCLSGPVSVCKVEVVWKWTLLFVHCVVHIIFLSVCTPSNLTGSGVISSYVVKGKHKPFFTHFFQKNVSEV